MRPPSKPQKGPAVKLLIALAAIVVVVVLVRRAWGRKPFAGAEEEAPEAEATFSEEEYTRHMAAKQAGLERVLGPMHHLVSHALIPFELGGPVDLYYFPGAIPGTGLATMELIRPDGSGPKPGRIGTYELVGFTRLTLPPPDCRDEQHPFHRIERRLRSIFTTLGMHSCETVLNPGETCEIPGDDDTPDACLVLDEYAPDGIPFTIDGRRHGLLLCIEVFRAEMEYARKHGGRALLAKLKQAGHYPYSDLDRQPVCNG